MAAPTSFGKDTGLQARMLLTVVLLGLVYAVLLGALFASGASGVTIALIGGGMFLFQAFASEKLAMRAMGAREVSPQEAPELHAMIERLCIQADLPKPRIAVAQNAMPNAFAMGIRKKNSVVCATTGIMELLSPSELEAVMAHELTHVANRDVAIMTFASFFASIAAMIVQWGFYFTGGGDDDEDGLGVLGLILVSAVVWGVSFTLMRTLSRYREFAADRGAAVITGRPSALVTALRKLEQGMGRIPAADLRTQEMAAFFIFPPKAKSAITGIFSTHPPMAKRIEALERLEGQLQGTDRKAVWS
ncbi:MAG: peptidase Ste24p [Solirubrobacterales bacterium]|nr:peptidase Ste24p [Solirubrobacterales bacterium]